MTRLICMVLALASVFASADEPPAGAFPEVVDVEGRRLTRNGVGLLEWGLFEVDLYWAGLYLEERTQDARRAIDSRQTKRLVKVFVRDLTRDQMHAAYRAAFEAAAGADLERHRAPIEQLLALIPAVSEGDRMVMHEDLDRGLIVELNGDARGSVAGASFGRLFWTLFLGATPPSAQLKRGLLGGQGS